jgi:hypothetical protein
MTIRIVKTLTVSNNTGGNYFTVTGVDIPANRNLSIIAVGSAGKYNAIPVGFWGIGQIRLYNGGTYQSFAEPVEAFKECTTVVNDVVAYESFYTCVRRLNSPVVGTGLSLRIYRPAYYQTDITFYFVTGLNSTAYYGDNDADACVKSSTINATLSAPGIKFSKIIGMRAYSCGGGGENNSISNHDPVIVNAGSDSDTYDWSGLSVPWNGYCQIAHVAYWAEDAQESNMPLFARFGGQG